MRIRRKKRKKNREMGWCIEKKPLDFEYTPHLLMVTCSLGASIFIVLLQTLMTNGVSSFVFVFYEHFVSTLLLSCLSFFIERGKRPPFKLGVFFWTFFLGFLEIPLCQLLLTTSLGYITASFQSTALNTIPAITFVIAVIFRREAFRLCTLNGQAKIWGIILSFFGATIMVLWIGPGLSGFNPSYGSTKQVIGSLMMAGSIFASASWSILVEDVAKKYPGKMSLAAMMCFWGTLQTGIIAGLIERNASAWVISFRGDSELPLILYGGIVVTGLVFYAQTWVIHKKGPVFGNAFSPLIIIFTFILETLVMKKAAHVGSIVGAVFVIIGLYLLLWAKADDTKKKALQENLNSPSLNTYVQVD